MEEEDLILMVQEQARQQQPLQPLLQTLNSIDTRLEKLPIRTNKSMRISIDLTKAHDDEPLGLEFGVVYLWLTIEKADSAFTYKLKQVNEQKSGIFTAAQGASLDYHEFTEIFITNTVTLGTAVIQVGWRE